MRIVNCSIKPTATPTQCDIEQQHCDTGHGIVYMEARVFRRQPRPDPNGTGQRTQNFGVPTPKMYDMARRNSVQ